MAIFNSYVCLPGRVILMFVPFEKGIEAILPDSGDRAVSQNEGSAKESYGHVLIYPIMIVNYNDNLPNYMQFNDVWGSLSW